MRTTAWMQEVEQRREQLPETQERFFRRPPPAAWPWRSYTYLVPLVLMLTGVVIAALFRAVKVDQFDGLEGRRIASCRMTTAATAGRAEKNRRQRNENSLGFLTK